MMGRTEWKSSEFLLPRKIVNKNTTISLEAAGLER
jgi:hypothetical protein